MRNNVERVSGASLLNSDFCNGTPLYLSAFTASVYRRNRPWTRAEKRLRMTTIYQFQKLDLCTGVWRTSRRWGTRSAIKGLGDNFRILAETATHVEEDIDLWSDFPGLTVIGFVPPPSIGQPIEQRDTKKRAVGFAHSLVSSFLSRVHVLTRRPNYCSATQLAAEEP